MKAKRRDLRLRTHIEKQDGVDSHREEDRNTDRDIKMQGYKSQMLSKLMSVDEFSRVLEKDWIFLMQL